MLGFYGLTRKMLLALVGADQGCTTYKTASYTEDYVDSRVGEKSKSVLIPLETEEALLSKHSSLIDYFIIIQYESSLIP